MVNMDTLNTAIKDFQKSEPDLTIETEKQGNPDHVKLTSYLASRPNDRFISILTWPNYAKESERGYYDLAIRQIWDHIS